MGWGADGVGLRARVCFSPCVPEGGFTQARVCTFPRGTLGAQQLCVNRRGGMQTRRQLVHMGLVAAGGLHGVMSTAILGLLEAWPNARALFRVELLLLTGCPNE